MPASKFSICLTILSCIGLPNAARAADPIATALVAAVGKHTDHACDWLEAKDYKSLARSAGGLELLTQLLRARSDDAAWQAATAPVVAAAGELVSAARAEDDGRSHTALARMEEALAAMQSAAPAGKPLATPRGPALRSLMQTLENVQADAKIALIAGNVAGAKNQAYVLSELGRVVSNSRNSEGWSAMSEDFIAAAESAARSPLADAKEVRPLFRTISERCVDCHDSR